MSTLLRVGGWSVLALLALFAVGFWFAFFSARPPLTMPKPAPVEDVPVTDAEPALPDAP